MHPRTRTLSPAAALALALLAACGDDGTRPQPAPARPANTLTELRCTATVAPAAVACVEADPNAASARRGGPRAAVRTVGNQGRYVRLASSNAAYAGGVYSVDVTVQNLSNLPFGTADGTARHAQGVRTFFHVEPSGAGGTVTVANATGMATYTATSQSYFQYGGQIGGVDGAELGGDGILDPAETSSARSWQFNVPGTVTAFSFSVFVAAEIPSGALVTVAPQVSSISPATLVPGGTATLTGINFDSTAAGNAVTIGGVAATVTGGTATELQVTVPCVATGSVAVNVTTGGMRGADLAHPLQGNVRTLAVGQAAVVSDGSQVACNELPATGAAARYVVAVYNTSTSPGTTAGFQVASDVTGVPPRQVRAPAAPRLDRAAYPGEPSEERHAEIMERNRRAMERLRARPASRGPRVEVSREVVPPPATREFRVANINVGDICNNYFSVNATRVYYNGKVAIYEDDATPAGLKASANAAMQSYYTLIGDQYNADMEPVIRTNFGDPILRDTLTDNNGVLVALFTPTINNQFGGVAGFVVGCDLYARGAGNESSNHGEVFYAYQPTVVGTGYASFTPDSWYWSIRATFIHETKHLASYQARAVSGAPFEAGWLEEGTARHSEEMWARTSVYGVAWKGNTGYGSAAVPGSVYCDNRPSWASCQATNPRRPSLNMYRHFQGLYTFLRAPGSYSPFGSTSAGGSSFYATSWSLVRYAIDRYGASDAAFLTALNSSTTTGTTNLAARSGVSLEQLMGGWALALYADDYPGLAAPTTDLQMPTWDFRSMYTGMNTDFPATFATNYPITPTALTLGSFSPVSVASVAGGGVAYFELSGTHTQTQLLKLLGTGGGAVPSTFRVAIARLQ